VRVIGTEQMLRALTAAQVAVFELIDESVLENKALAGLETSVKEIEKALWKLKKELS